jgi:glycerol uptake facilitator protein
VWGLGIATAIYLTGSLSGAHLNPAVTLSFVVWRHFPLRRALGYIVSQLLGAFVAAAVLFFIYADALQEFERRQGIVRGQAGSEASAMIFGEYFPNPQGQPLLKAPPIISQGRAFFTEFIGTAVLLLVIFSVTDEQNKSRPQILTAATIGLTITLLISLFGPLTMACFNPARDFAPRVFSSLAGWGFVPFSANGLGWLTVYIVAPILGAQMGGGLYRVFLKPHYEQPTVL